MGYGNHRHSCQPTTGPAARPTCPAVPGRRRGVGSRWGGGGHRFGSRPGGCSGWRCGRLAVSVRRPGRPKPGFVVVEVTGATLTATDLVVDLGVAGPGADAACH